jgi:hypothetical protein
MLLCFIFVLLALQHQFYHNFFSRNLPHIFILLMLCHVIAQHIKKFYFYGRKSFLTLIKSSSVSTPGAGLVAVT